MLVDVCCVLMSSLVIRVHVVSRIRLNPDQCWKLLLTVSMCVCCQAPDEQVVKPPVVSVYSAASRTNREGKSSLLCLASSMFPPEVQFSWKRQKKGGSLEDLTPAQGEQLEVRDSGHSTSIRLVDGNDLHMYRHHCYINHEGGTVNTTIGERVEAEPKEGASATSSPLEKETADQAALQQHHLSFQSQCRVKLLCLLYTVLIVKSLVYCCGLSLLTSLRNKGPSTSSTHAD